MINLNELAIKTLHNAKKREANGAKINCQPYSMMKHCATEVIEAMRAYDEWQTYLRFGSISMGVTDPDFNKYTPKQQFENELADIICCCLIIAGDINCNIEEAVLRCIEKKNRLRAEGMGDKK